MKAPTKLPYDIYDLYDFLSYDNAYDEETLADFKQRMLLLNDLNKKMEEAGMTIDHLAGVRNPIIEPQFKSSTPKWYDKFRSNK